MSCRSMITYLNKFKAENVVPVITFAIIAANKAIKL